MTAHHWITRLGLRPHPEGGHYAEVWREAAAEGERGSLSSIHFLLQAGELSRWHRVDAVELWLWQAGAPLELSVFTEGKGLETFRLGPGEGESFQGVVPKGVWQSARSLGEWTLVSCVVAPEFRWEGFEMAPEGWEPGTAPG